ncbi:MAG: hypothetical protein L6R41_002994 [Letrouitia leprolyta]|nr:MAG: hypothetical protein L6R41_002994 [Letrouitia leprolyta]
MQAKFAYIILVALSALTSATPVEPTSAAATAGSIADVPVGPDPEPESFATPTEVGDNARAAKTVKLCTDAGFRGRCATYGSTNRVCYNPPGSYNDVVSAFGPSSGQRCTIYQ